MIRSMGSRMRRIRAEPSALAVFSLSAVGPCPSVSPSLCPTAARSNKLNNTASRKNFPPVPRSLRVQDPQGRREQCLPSGAHRPHPSPHA
eukprot:CAMPEP_0171734222 /NCGR_PEP_ID=MMETSP0991-20121206/30785_1 /TAXON_ID=483369 /ORGANISM="non described non described, Strain CCMP2098" /LENGTH=89 /DNA_ID=CAMNT_0012330159 /DNA_START=725 /DNA_END=994 /DNA_ORIENTATION=-